MADNTSESTTVTLMVMVSVKVKMYNNGDYEDINGNVAAAHELVKATPDNGLVYFGGHSKSYLKHLATELEDKNLTANDKTKKLAGVISGINDCYLQVDGADEDTVSKLIKLALSDDVLVPGGEIKKFNKKWLRENQQPKLFVLFPNLPHEVRSLVFHHAIEGRTLEFTKVLKPGAISAAAQVFTVRHARPNLALASKEAATELLNHGGYREDFKLEGDTTVCIYNASIDKIMINARVIFNGLLQGPSSTLPTNLALSCKPDYDKLKVISFDIKAFCCHPAWCFANLIEMPFLEKILVRGWLSEDRNDVFYLKLNIEAVEVHPAAQVDPYGTVVPARESVVEFFSPSGAVFRIDYSNGEPWNRHINSAKVRAEISNGLEHLVDRLDAGLTFPLVEIEADIVGYETAARLRKAERCA